VKLELTGDILPKKKSNFNVFRKFSILSHVYGYVQHELVCKLWVFIPLVAESLNVIRLWWDKINSYAFVIY